MEKSSEVGERVVDRRSVGGFARASPDFGCDVMPAMYRHVFASLGVWPIFASYAGVGIYDGHAHKKKLNIHKTNKNKHTCHKTNKTKA